MNWLSNSVLSSFCVLAVWSSAAESQEDLFDLGTIVLRGELQSRDIQESPTSAAVVTGSSLEQRGDQSLDNVIERTPGVNSVGARVGVAIRGISESGTAGAGRGLTVSTQVDGVALPTVFSTIFGPDSTWDLEQVEVLRGPQSTQQGRNALAGAIIIRSKDPEFTPEYKFHLEAGSRDHTRAAFVLNQPLIEDRLAVRLSYENLSNDGYIFNEVLNTDEFDANEMETFRLKFRWAPSNVFETTVSYTRTENFAGEDFVRAARFPDRISRAGEPAREGARHDIFGVRATWDINDSLSLESETSYYELDYTRIEDFDHSPFLYGITNGRFFPETFEQDLRLRFETPGLTGVVGLFYTKIDDASDSLSTTDLGFINGGAPNGILISSRDISSGTTENTAIFGEVDIAADRVLPGLTFTLGARYDYEKFDSFTNSVVLGFPVPPTVSSVSGEFDAFLPKFSARYELSDDRFLAFTIQRGYRAGGTSFNTLAAATPGEVATLPYDPEFTTNYEIAYRASFRDGALRFAANAFYTEWTDQQVTQTGRVSGNIDNFLDIDVINAGASRLYGGELSVESEPFANLTLFASLAYVRTKFTDFVVNKGSSAEQNLTGNEFPAAPRFTGALGGSYSWDNGVTFSMDASYTGSSFGNVQNTEKTDSRFLVNTQLTYETPDGWTAGLYVRNVFDRDYVTLRSSVNLGPEANTPPDPFDDTGVTGTFRTGEPRTVGFYLRKVF